MISDKNLIVCELFVPFCSFSFSVLICLCSPLEGRSMASTKESEASVAMASVICVTITV